MAETALSKLNNLTESDIKVLNDFSGYLEFVPTQVFQWLINSPCKITVLFTGNQFGKGECLQYDTKVETVSGNIPIGKLYEAGKPFKVWAWDGEKKVKANASAPFKKDGLYKCYKITMSDGQWIKASGGHRILTPSGEFCSVSLIHDSFVSALRKKSVSADEDIYRKFGEKGSRSIRALGDRRLFGTLSDYLRYCLACFRLCGEQLLMAIGNVRFSVPLQDGVRQLFPVVLNMDDLDYKCTNTQKSDNAHLSNLYDRFQNVGQFFGSLWKVSCTKFRQLFRGHQEFARLSFVKLSQPQSVSVTGQNIRSSDFLAYDSPLCFNGNHIISIEPIACQEVYDFEVEKYHNYFAGDLVHHNTVVMDYYLRVWGKHPIKHKNILPDDKIRTIRWASETLPGESENEDITNTQYPVFKRRFNPSWLIKDITAREKVVRVQPQTMRILADGEKCLTKPVNFEYVSYGQTTQRGAGFQRRSVWIDESAPMDFFGEQIPRLLAADGDLILSYTPTPGKMGWEFEYFYERAKIIYRTKFVRNRLKERFGEDVPEVEHKDSKHDICVIMAATDDNPIYERLAKEKSERVGHIVTVDEYITDSLGLIADEDEKDARRYGLFKQMSGNIFKAYNEKIHRISFDKYFPDGVPHEWKHFRGIDWHESNNWAIGWIAVSPNDEIFVYNEFNPSPEKMITLEIMRVVCNRSKDYKFDLNLIDPLASKVQPNTGLSSLEDINRISAEFKRQGIGTGGWWQSWDTKSQKGRDEIKKRLQNSTMCGVPFNNEVKKEGITKRLPTLWVCDNCLQTNLSLRNWRLEEWGDRTSLITKDHKETPQQRWSHFCTMLEGLLKRPEVFQARFHTHNITRPPKEYFKGN